MHRSFNLAAAPYFDDFPFAVPRADASSVHRTFKKATRLLGWKRQGEKEKGGWRRKFVALGALFNISRLRRRTHLVVESKPGRREKAVTVIDHAVAANAITKPMVDSLRGQLSFAQSQLFGRLGGSVFRALDGLERTRPAGLKARLASLRTQLGAFFELPPRRVRCGRERRPVIIMTDGAAEGAHFEEVGVGALMFDPVSASAEFFGGRLDAATVRRWRVAGQDQVIEQGVAWRVVLSRLAWGDVLKHRTCIHFIDNEGVRLGFLRQVASHPVTAELQERFWMAEAALGCHTWLERVDSGSNIADAPSRLDFELMLRLGLRQIGVPIMR